MTPVLSSAVDKCTCKSIRHGRLFVISAPSGAGKTTLCNALLKCCRTLAYSVSHTTRKPRKGERNGTDYHFITEAEFRKMIERDAWVEWAHVHGNYYGTSREAIEHHLQQGRDILLDVDVQGARQIVERTPEAVTIFIAPPSLAALKERLIHRGTDDAETIARRLAEAENEMRQMGEYTHVVVNEDRKEATAELMTLIQSYGGCPGGEL